MGIEGFGKRKLEKILRGTALAAMVAGKLAAGDAAAAGMAGNREAMKKLDGVQTTEVYNQKIETIIDPPKKDVAQNDSEGNERQNAATQ